MSVLLLRTLRYVPWIKPNQVKIRKIYFTQNFLGRLHYATCFSFYNQFKIKPETLLPKVTTMKNQKVITKKGVVVWRCVRVYNHYQYSCSKWCSQYAAKIAKAISPVFVAAVLLYLCMLLMRLHIHKETLFLVKYKTNRIIKFSRGIHIYCTILRQYVIPFVMHAGSDLSNALTVLEM